MSETTPLIDGGSVRHPILRSLPIKRWILWLLAPVGLGFLVLGVTWLLPSESKRIEKLDRELATAVKDWNIPGVAVAAIRRMPGGSGFKVVFEKGYGIRNANGDPVTTKTRFQIGSTSKAFTSMLVAGLVSEGKLDWKTPVTKYLAGFAFNDSFANERANLIDVLSHRTGVPRGDLSIMFMNSTTDSLERLRKLKPLYDLRDGWEYQNNMFSLAGIIAGKAELGSSQTSPSGVLQINEDYWHQAVRQRIFAPLGMDGTSSRIVDWLRDKDNHAEGFLHPGSTEEGLPAKAVNVPPELSAEFMRTATAAGDISSNVHDLTKWMAFILDHGKLPNGTALVDETNFRQLVNQQSFVQPAFAVDPSTALRLSYGLGWNIGSHRGRKMISHGGSTAGKLSRMDVQTCHVCLFPQDEVGVFVLTNSASSFANLACYNVADRLFFQNAPLVEGDVQDYFKYGQQRLKESERQNAEINKMILAGRRPETFPEAHIGKFSGAFHHGFYGIWKVLPISADLHSTFTLDARRKVSLMLKLLEHSPRTIDAFRGHSLKPQTTALLREDEIDETAPVLLIKLPLAFSRDVADALQLPAEIPLWHYEENVFFVPGVIELGFVEFDWNGGSFTFIDSMVVSEGLDGKVRFDRSAGI
ncbi:beta-lactamase/transpeptidase-like protein [Cladochytrium replicatum]|nr:beta-lactamase/transpeptidase-like protein [Cladochytrium replicatum]